MTPRDTRPGRRSGNRRVPYWVGYGLTAGLLLLVTGTLVLVVLPSRYALVADLRESGFSFPTSADAVAFEMPDREPLIKPPAPTVPVERAPGPAEALWADVDSLLAARDYAGAIARMEAYLEANPGDVAIARERARTLVIAGRPAAARATLEDLVRRTGARTDRLALARLLRDAGELEASVELYRALIADRPNDLELRFELARLFAWAQDYEGAERELRALVDAAPREGRFRLALARVLYWHDRPAEARVALAGMPEGTPEAAEAAALDRELVRLLTPPPQPEPEPSTLAERAREAAAAGDFEAARQLYDEALAASPGDTAIARERIDFLQFRVEDPEAALRALEAYGDRFGLDADGRYRLDQLQAWTGRETEARRSLEAVLRDEPGRADAWALLGDVRRYADERAQARSAYARSLALEPGHEQATAGLVELDRLREATIAAREPVGVGPTVSLFSDSDDFLRLDLGGGAGWIGSVVTLDFEVGFRRLEGRDPAGLLAKAEGGFARLEAGRWWSEASLRTALHLGVDHLDTAGTEPTFGLSVARFGRSGRSLALRYDHGPAYPITYTLESALADVSADRVEVAAFAPIGMDWSIAVAAEAARLAAAGTANTRLGGSLTVGRRFAPWLTADVGTRLLGFTDPSPNPGSRLYWDPALFWANTAGVTLGITPPEGIGYRVRLSGGAAWVDERDTPGAGWIPQYGAEAGLTWRSDRTLLDLSTFYRRGREDEYSSFGAAFTLRIRP